MKTRTLCESPSLLVLALVLLLAASARAQDGPCQTASRFGPDDQIGNVRHVTPAKTLAASKLITAGRSYRLGIETNKDTPAYGTRRFSMTVLQPDQAGGVGLGPTRTTYNDDIITGWVGVGSQIDGFGHVGIDNVYFNCNRAVDFTRADGLTKLGIENIPAIATRGILLDVAGYLGTDIVKEGTAINRAEIEGAMRRQGIKAIEKGDVVLFHTGWMQLLGKDNKRFISVGPGLGRDGSRYLASLGVAAVGIDTPNFEVIPFENGAGVYEVHQILLAMNGVHLLENMNTTELARDQAWEFFFTLGTPRITGGVQAMVNPIAIK